MRLNNTGLTPSCGWIYTIPKMRLDIKAESYEELVLKVKENYTINNIAIDSSAIESSIHEFICKKCPTGFCSSFVNRFSFTARTLLNGTIALSIMMRQGKGSFVDQEVAEKRAAICVKCQFNAENPSCYACKGFERTVKAVTHGRITTVDYLLKVCGICGCFCKALVHVDIGILRATTRKNQIKQYPDGCWKRKTLEQQE